MRVSIDAAGDGKNVEHQVGRTDSGSGEAEGTHLERKEQKRAGDSTHRGDG